MPRQSRAQELGTEGERWFASRLPPSWINSDSEVQCSFVALLLAACYGERLAFKNAWTRRSTKKLTSQTADSVFAKKENFTVRNVKYGTGNKWMGQSGFKHQIDVTIEGPTAPRMIHNKGVSGSACTECVCPLTLSR